MLDFLALPDVDAAVLIRAAQGQSPTGIGAELAQICALGGDADALAARLRDTLPTGGRWTQT